MGLYVISGASTIAFCGSGFSGIEDVVHAGKNNMLNATKDPITDFFENAEPIAYLFEGKQCCGIWIGSTKCFRTTNGARNVV